MVEDTTQTALTLGQVLHFCFQEFHVSGNFCCDFSGISILIQLAAKTIPSGMPSTSEQTLITSGILSSVNQRQVLCVQLQTQIT